MWVLITDNFGRETKPSVYVVKVQLGNSWSGDIYGTRQEDCCSGTSMVNNREDGIEASSIG